MSIPLPPLNALTIWETATGQNVTQGPPGNVLQKRHELFNVCGLSLRATIIKPDL